MKFKLHNSLSKRIEEFHSIDKEEVRIYSCGPTVYSYAHIGNMRSFLFADLLQRTLKVVGNYKVKWVMNITDIDDKTIRDSKPENGNWNTEMSEPTNDPLVNLRNFTNFYIDEFIKDIEKVGISKSDVFLFPKATDHIEEMIELITLIFNNGFAYITDGNVYFNVNKWREHKQYGRLKKIDFENFKKGVRIEADEYDREDVSDFALWKNKKEGEPFWNFTLNNQELSGRPGWHLECSAMEKKYLDLPFDIHTGGVDLQFPHHEDEIAQSHAGYGIDPTKYWSHCEFLEVEGKKMSKSFGNYFTLRDLEDKGYDTLDIRFAILSQHYRTKYNFTFDGISSAAKGRKKVQNFIDELLSDKTGTTSINVAELKHLVYTELAEDLHTPKALAQVFSFVNDYKTSLFDLKSKDDLINFFKELNNIFAVWNFELSKVEIPSEIQQLAEERFKAKVNKNWQLADDIRKDLHSKGYEIKDSKDSYEIIKL